MSRVLPTRYLCDFITEGLSYYEVIINTPVVKRRISYDLFKHASKFFSLDFDVNFIEYKISEITYYKIFDPLLYSCIQYYWYQVSDDHVHSELLETLNEYLGVTYKDSFDKNTIDVPWGIETMSDLKDYYGQNS